MQHIRPKAWRLWLAMLWLTLTLSLSAWWMIHGMNQSKALNQNISTEAAARQHRMFFWEGLFLLTFVSLGGGALGYSAYREQRQNQEIRKFFSVFTHELKTSLTSLRLQAEILEESIEKGSNQTLDRLLKDVVRLELQLENALILANVRTSKLFFEPISAKKLIQALAVHWPQLTFIFSGDEKVLADQRALECIFRNLLQNASVHGSAKNITVTISAGHNKSILLDIADDGKGFKGICSELGKALVRHDTRSGSGVGLFLTRQLMHRMSGEISFTSNPSGGFRALLTFPGASA